MEYRHPMALNTDLLHDLDVMIVGSIARILPSDQDISTGKAKKESLNNQINHFYDRLTHCLSSCMNAKVLLPVSPQFILEIVDLLLHKTSDRIVFISESANQVIQYSNINVEYLSKML